MSQRNAEKEQDNPGTSPCMHGLLAGHAAVPGSCLSASQIQNLFKRFQNFMSHQYRSRSPEDSKESVERLFPDSLSLQRKHALIHGRDPSVQGELKWVCLGKDPNDFIAHLRRKKNIMPQLQLSFKPPLCHDRVLRRDDLLALSQRYAYGLKRDQQRRLMVLGVEYENSSPSNMVQALETHFYDYRFHLALFGTRPHRWTMVLIHRNTHNRPHQVEIYDPSYVLEEDWDNHHASHSSNTTASQVRSLIKAVQARDGRENVVVKKSSVLDETGSEDLTKDYGMLVVYFWHLRVVRNVPFEKIERTRLSNPDSRHMRTVFFRDEKTKSGGHSKANHSEPSGVPTVKHAFAEHDVRVAFLQFARYMESWTKHLASSAAQRKAENLSSELLQAIGDKKQGQVLLDKRAFDFEQSALSVLPHDVVQRKDFHLWSSLLEEITTDPLTEYLRGMERKKYRHGSVKVRSGHAQRKMVVQELWTQYRDAVEADDNDTESNNRERGRHFDEYAADVLNQLYVPLLLQFAAATTHVYQNMTPMAFLEEMMKKKGTVSWGVHFLREMYGYAQSTFGIRLRDDLHGVRFAPRVLVGRPVSIQNAQDVGRTLHDCDQVLRRARALLAPSLAPGQPPRAATQPVSKLQQMVVLTRVDLESGKFFAEPVQPWHFPLDVKFASTSSVSSNPRWMNYSVTAQDQAKLLTSETFLTYYALAVLTTSAWGLMQTRHEVPTQALTQEPYSTLPARLSLMTESLLQLFAVAWPGSHARLILCTLLRYTESVLDPLGHAFLGRIQRALQECPPEPDDNTPFFQKVFYLHEQLRQ